MKKLKYVEEIAGETIPFSPNWNSVVILSKHNGVMLHKDATMVIDPLKALCFSTVDVANYFLSHFKSDMDSYNEAIPKGEVYHLIDCNRLKATTYADRLVSR